MRLVLMRHKMVSWQVVKTNIKIPVHEIRGVDRYYGRHDLMEFCLEVLEIPNTRELNGFTF